MTAQDTAGLFSFTSVLTRTAEIQPSVTETATGLISTSSACAQISDIVSNGQVTDENCVLLQETLEPYYIHRYVAKANDDGLVTVTQLPPCRYCYSVSNR